jgi:hypothetical protein
MIRCPLCRAALGGADTCRRCRADLGAAQGLERASQALVEAACHRLAKGDVAGAQVLAGRAMVLHATPESRALGDVLRALRQSGDVALMRQEHA